jgi:plastocyanin
LLVALATAGGLQPASAANLQITVTGPEGRPAPDTVVLLQTVVGNHRAAVPAEALTIVQQQSRFVPYVTVAPLGATLRFTNRDSYDHHVRSQPGGPLGSVAPAKQFEFRLDKPKGKAESSADLKLDVPGTILLGCHLHNAMRGHVFITTTPWYGVTDEQGRVTLRDVPEGVADLRLWHPDQLLDQASTRLQVQGDTALSPRLNFNARKRPTPRPLPPAS